VLRKAKQTYRDSKLGISIKHPIISLVELKHTTPFAGCIHLISADPFIVHYWTPTQMVVYKDACKSHNKNSRLCIDATGSVVKKIFRTSQALKSAHIFLYVAVLHNGTLQLPISQMLSESQDTPTITFWLSQWLRSGAPSPTEIVCDYSNALIGAITRSFCGGMSKKQYCETSLKILKNKDATLPEVYVRLDIAHFTKIEIEGNERYACRYCNKNYKENVTRMAVHIKNECKEVPQCISKSLLSPNKSKFNHCKFI